ncbi:MAG: hypothetical protein JST84_10795 [Acidobacteria bacterium]|nr:hypothetical protein [Acidobacteriota bacterium]
MKIRKGIKLKVRARIANPSEALTRTISKQAVQPLFDNPRSAFAELQVKVTAVNVSIAGEMQVSFVIKGECEATSDFAAYTSEAIQQMLADFASLLGIEKLLIDKITES